MSERGSSSFCWSGVMCETGFTVLRGCAFTVFSYYVNMILHFPFWREKIFMEGVQPALAWFRGCLARGVVSLSLRSVDTREAGTSSTPAHQHTVRPH